jgi:hypothetical protein
MKTGVYLLKQNNKVVYVGATQKWPETQGKKALKQYNLRVGELAEFDPKEQARIRYRARVEVWKIKIRSVAGKIIVFREC